MLNIFFISVFKMILSDIFQTTNRFNAEDAAAQWKKINSFAFLCVLSDLCVIYFSNLPRKMWHNFIIVLQIFFKRSIYSQNFNFH